MLNGFRYYDFRQQVSSNGIELLFPGWRTGQERVAVFSPHDDDALLGAGYAMLAARSQGADVFVMIFCDGSAGYSSPGQKDSITAIRRSETLAAYGSIKLPQNHIIRWDYPDFSLLPFIGRRLPGGENGTFEKVLKTLRSLQITRLLIPNGYHEHIDHEAAYRIGAYDGPQAGDPILADWGLGCPLLTTLIYAVWGDFSPEDALVQTGAARVRANRAIRVQQPVETCIRAGLACFESQGSIIAGLLAARQKREQHGQYLELYLDLDPRPALDYSPYHELAGRIDKE